MMRDMLSFQYFSSTRKNKELTMVHHRLLFLALTFTVALSFESANNTEQLNGTAENNSQVKDWCPNSIQKLLKDADLTCTETADEDADADGRSKLYVVLMAPFPALDPANNPSWVAGDVLAPSMQLALDHINSRQDILSDYKLEMLAKDTFCSRGYKAWKAIVDILRCKKRIVGIVGPGCSGAAIDVAEQLRKPGYSLIGITIATSPNLEKSKYSNTFAAVSSGTAYVRVFKELMDYNEWYAVSVLYDEGRDYFLDLFTNFENNVDNNRIAYQSPVSNGDNNSQKFFPFTDITGMDRGRVILTFASGSTARNMICLAYNYGMVYPKYQWIFPDRTIAHLHQSVSEFVYQGERFKCSKQDMARALHGILLIHYAIAAEDSDVITPIGEKYYNFSSKFRDTLCTNDTVTDYVNTYYDAAWALAFALNATSERINLTTYRHGQPNKTEEIRDELLKVGFRGASGQIQFDKERRSVTTRINIFQVNCTNIENVDMVPVAYFSDNNLSILSNSSLVFIKDTFVNVPVHIHTALGVFVILIALVLLAFTVILHIANTVWYSYRSIKATSPNISHLIFGGCYLFSIAIIIYSAQQTSNSSRTVYSVLCNTFRWCFILGYTLIFGTVLAKVWRVYRLFKHFSNESPGFLVTDNALVIFVILLLTADILICTIWDVIDPFVRADSIAETVEINNIPSLLIRSECQCNFFVYWVGIISAYKGAIALLLVAFSIMNRKIRRRDFQHTKKINILIYSLTMMGGVLFPIFFLLRKGDIHISFVILCLMLSVAVLMSCLSLFLTPVSQVIKIKMGLAEDASFKTEIKRKVSTISLISFRSSNNEEL